MDEAWHFFMRILEQSVRRAVPVWNGKNKDDRKTAVGPILGKDNSELVEDLDMAEELNRHFSEVFITEDNSSIPATEPWARCPPIITTLSVTKRQVLAKIGKMVAHSSPGPDGISPRLLKELAREIAGPLSKIFQKSLQEGFVPADWKFANVTPKHKKGCMDNPYTYRPISTSSVVGKLFESIVKDAITDHLLNNYLIWNTQHSFIPQKQNTNRKDFITSVTEQGKSVDIVCLDFLKAFDKIP